jgi:hypothetical protein
MRRYVAWPNIAFLILALSNLGLITPGSLCIELGKAVIMMLLSCISDVDRCCCKR